MRWARNGCGVDARRGNQSSTRRLIVTDRSDLDNFWFADSPPRMRDSLRTELPTSPFLDSFQIIIRSRGTMNSTLIDLTPIFRLCAMDFFDFGLRELIGNFKFFSIEYQKISEFLTVGKTDVHTLIAGARLGEFEQPFNPVLIEFDTHSIYPGSW